MLNSCNQRICSACSSTSQPRQHLKQTWDFPQQCGSKDCQQCGSKDCQECGSTNCQQCGSTDCQQCGSKDCEGKEEAAAGFCKWENLQTMQRILAALTDCWHDDDERKPQVLRQHTPLKLSWCQDCFSSYCCCCCQQLLLLKGGDGCFQTWSRRSLDGERSQRSCKRLNRRE